jgi:hypothetical protein
VLSQWEVRVWRMGRIGTQLPAPRQDSSTRVISARELALLRKSAQMEHFYELSHLLKLTTSYGPLAVASCFSCGVICRHST